MVTWYEIRNSKHVCALFHRMGKVTRLLDAIASLIRTFIDSRLILIARKQPYISLWTYRTNNYSKHIVYMLSSAIILNYCE